MSAPPAPRVLFAAPDLLFGEWQNVCLAVWRAKPTLASARQLSTLYRATAKRHPQGFVVLGVIEADAMNIGDEERKAITAAMDAVEHELRGIGMVLEASGFVSAAIRAVLATMSQLTRSRFPRKVFGAVDEASTWLAPLAGPHVDARTMRDAFREMRASSEAHPR